MHSTSEQVIACARGYIGTRFHHQGRLKATSVHKGGIDCLGLLVGVAQELGLMDKTGQLLAEHDELNYGHYPDGVRLKEILGELLRGGAEILQPGQVGLFTLDGNPQHLGIVGEDTLGMTLIHAYAPARKVVESRFDKEWQGRLCGLFSLEIPAPADAGHHVGFAVEA